MEESRLRRRSVIHWVVDERLDMLPASNQMGFFSDAYCADWACAKAVLARKQLAELLARKVAQGQDTGDEALAVARRILYETPQTLLGMVPA